MQKNAWVGNAPPCLCAFFMIEVALGMDAMNYAYLWEEHDIGGRGE